MSFIDQLEYTTSTPRIFSPVTLRSGSKYQSLTYYAFSTEEKVWFCKEIADQLPGNNARKQKLKAMCSRHGLDINLAESWIKLYKRTGSCEQSFVIETCPIDDRGIAILQDFIARRAPSETHSEQLEAVIREQLEQTEVRKKRKTHMTYNRVQ